MATEFTPLASLIGGMLIGLAAVGLMATLGRIAGMTGIVAGLLPPWDKVEGWRAAFLAGAVAAPLVYLLATGAMPAFAIPPGLSLPLMIVSGLIVGVGVTFGSGCTSGHGVCGLARLSRRSLAAVLTFMASAAVTVYFARHILGIG
jgi:uncharacterized membrane protein YedE/YeeE